MANFLRILQDSAPNNSTEVSNNSTTPTNSTVPDLVLPSNLTVDTNFTVTNSTVQPNVTTHLSDLMPVVNFSTSHSMHCQAGSDDYCVETFGINNCCMNLTVLSVLPDLTEIDKKHLEAFASFGYHT